MDVMVIVGLGVSAGVKLGDAVMDGLVVTSGERVLLGLRVGLEVCEAVCVLVWDTV